MITIQQCEAALDCSGLAAAKSANLGICHAHQLPAYHSAATPGASRLPEP